MPDDSSPALDAGQPEAQKPREGIPWRMIAFGALAVYGLLLVALNTQKVHVEFVFWDARASLVVVLVLALAVGFLAGFLFDTLRDRRKRAARAKS